MELPLFFFYGKAFVLIGTGGYWLGDRASKSFVQRRLAKLARGSVDLSRLSNSEDGELVHLRGTIRTQSFVPSLLGGAPGVYRRVRAVYGETALIEEVAVDFQLVDADGNAIGIETEGARWLVQDAAVKAVAHPEALSVFEDLDFIKRFMNARPVMRTGRLYRPPVQPRASEQMLRSGDVVEVVGYKSRQVDPMMADRLHRETPMRATLRAGKELPLILSRVEVA